MNWRKTKKFGSKKLYEFLCRRYPQFDLYCISIDWEQSDDYIAKAKGVYGDIVIYWYGISYNNLTYTDFFSVTDL